jgi:UDP-N-acetylglucosamine--N-acetylmuramyl-(pentapeptide) pyrophosphoryl-undecaprenol N-acetylglucosamine transferase
MWLVRCMRVEFREQRVLFTGGGTAGHVSPGLAVYHALQRAAQVGRATATGPATTNNHLCALWVGSERIESSLVPAAGLSFRQIDIRFSYRRPTPGNWDYYRRHIVPIVLGQPFRQALATLDIFQPDLVIGTGGYVSAPLLWAARQRNVPYALIQCDAPPGLVNWHFAEHAWRIFAATPEVARGFAGRCALSKVQVAGYPVLPRKRSRETLCAELGIDPKRRLLVAMGGSLGSGAVHQAISQLLHAAAQQPSCRGDRLAVLSIGGSREGLAAAILDPRTLPAGPVSFHHTGYLEHAIDALYAADFYLGRAGAASVGELVASGIPALLIPDPQHADRQQYSNAGTLIARGQGTVLEQSAVTGVRILQWLDAVWDAQRRPAPQPAAADVIVNELSQLWAAG